MKNPLSVPSYKAGSIRLADFAEIMALRGPRFSTSQVDVISAFDRIEDEDEDKFEAPVKDAFAELARRSAVTASFECSYPFELKNDTLFLDRARLKSKPAHLYLFLLLATALNMKSDRKHGGFDGADLFEKLSEEVAKRYLGGSKDSRVKTKIFGTSRQIWKTNADTTENNDMGEFEGAINELCKDLGEGETFKTKTKLKISAKDDKLDVVAWREFTDSMPNKIALFGQCKTGTHWATELPRLNPYAFCARWFSDMPSVLPTKAHFLSDRVDSAEFRHVGYEAGIIFERCRILDYAGDIPKDLLEDCLMWSNAALKSLGLGNA
jgi:hypothetical protein